MLDWIIAISYACIIAFFISRTQSKSVSGIKPLWSVSAFVFKVLFGFLNYYIWMQVIGHGDSLRYVHDGQVVYQSLFDNPLYFLQLLTSTSIEHVPEHLVSYQHALLIEWHVPEYHMVRLLALLNVFSFGSVWGNIVLLAALVWWAQWQLFGVLIKRFQPSGKQTQVWFGILFLFPSTLFWSSGLLKEGPVLALLCLLIAQALTWPENTKYRRLRQVVYMLLIWCGLFMIRDYVAILVLVQLVGIGILFALPRAGNRPFWRLSAYVLLVTAVATALSVWHLTPDLFAHLQSEQAYFLLSGPDPDYTFRTLSGTPEDLVFSVPQVLNNVLFRPNLLHSSSVYRVYQSLELMGVIACCVFLFIRKGWRLKMTTLHAAILLLFLELLFVFGLMVTDADTLSRYRSVPMLGIVLMAVISLHAPATDRKSTE